MATAVKTVTGTLVGMSAVLPTTYDGDATTGYTPLTFTDIGEVVDVGEIAKAFATISHQTIGRKYPQKLKDTYDIANISLNLGRVKADAGQVILAAALESDNSYAFEVSLGSGNFEYFTAKVIKSGVGSIASGNVESGVVELAIDPETLFGV